MDCRKFASLSALVAGLYACQPAFAGVCENPCGTVASECVPAKTTAPYRLVAFSNEDGTNTIGLTDDGTTPVIGASGTWTVKPGATRIWWAANVSFIGPFKCISSAGTPAVSVNAK